MKKSTYPVAVLYSLFFASSSGRSNALSRFYSNRCVPIQTFINSIQTVVIQHLHVFQGGSHASRNPIRCYVIPSMDMSRYPYESRYTDILIKVKGKKS